MNANTDQSLERGLPAAVDAERSILGAILLDNELMSEAARSLEPDHFSLDAHRRLYGRMRKLDMGGNPIDQITLLDELNRSKELDHVGGIPYIAGLTDRVPRRTSIEHYVRIVREKATRRALIHISNGVMKQAMDGPENAGEILDSAEQSLLAIRAEQTGEQEPKLSEQLMKVLNRLEIERRSERELLGLTLAVPDLDYVTQGLRAGELMVVGALPERGKTAYAMQVARENAKRGDGVAVFSLEMGADPILSRCLATIANVHPSKMRNPKWMDDDERDRLFKATEEMSQWPLFIQENGSLTPIQLVSRARLYVRRERVKLIIVDHLKAMSFRAPGRDPRTQINYAMESLRLLAKEENVAVIVLHHLARPLNKDINAEPNMLWLKESGDIEAAVHIALLLHRPQDDQGRWTFEDKIIQGKMRDGVKGPVPVRFDERALEYKPRLLGAA